MLPALRGAVAREWIGRRCDEPAMVESTAPPRTLVIFTSQLLPGELRLELHPYAWGSASRGAAHLRAANYADVFSCQRRVAPKQFTK
jgi:hypothetical protein